MVLLSKHDTAETALVEVHLPLPDIFIIDVHLSGVECASLLRQRHPEVRIILLTAVEDAQELFQCLHSGACGYLMKGLPSAALMAGIRQVFFGGLSMSADMAPQMLQFFELPPPPPAFEFSKREHDVLSLLTRGLRYKEIAVELSVGTATVRTYLERAYTKLGVSNRTEAVARFLQLRR